LDHRESAIHDLMSPLISLGVCGFADKFSLFPSLPLLLL
jgi:hypothetical protein